jgi:uncharacterized protein (DUF1684 family)
MDDPELDPLTLADWRRRIAELYAAVRSASDPAEAHALWRETREEMYREHPASPVPPEQRRTFRAIHFAYDPALRFEVDLRRDLDPPAGRPAGSTGIELPVSTGRPRRFDRIGWLVIPFPEGERRLALFWLAEYSGGLFLAFRDGTNGAETYGGGRYLLDTGKGADLGAGAGRASVIVDFNFAYQPSCAFDSRWSCPLAAPENRLDLAVQAGERIA